MSEPKIAVAEVKPKRPAIADLPDLGLIAPPRIPRLLSQEIKVSERAARGRARFLKQLAIRRQKPRKEVSPQRCRPRSGNVERVQPPFQFLPGFLH